METIKNKVVIVTTNINKLKEVFESTNKEGLIAISDHYWLASHKTNANISMCTISDIMKSDIRSIDENDVYCDLIDTYGEDLTDRFIHLSQEIIEKKVIGLINFVFDKVYKSDEIQVILSHDNDSDIQEVIINIITNNFNIADTTANQYEVQILIKK